jgi:lycopene cyclase domain-containing protein
MTYTATYTALAIVGVILAAAIDLAVLRTRLLSRKAFWTTYAIVLFFQLIVNGLLTGLPVVRYEGRTIIGLHVVNAPVEDLLFGFCLVLLTLSIWVWLGRRSSARRADERSTN